QLHLSEVLDRLEQLAAAGADVDTTTVGLAAWFHDGVYDGGADDEELSAQWAERALPPAYADEVARLVRITAHHRPADDDVPGCALSDADLAILAAPRERYDTYAAGVRADFAHLADADFRAGRAAVLRDLASKEYLFHTPQARELWETAARANLDREISELA
ncbi:MAG TPA: hypothetical protein VLS46_01510, partial [Gaiellaceae bacterium]|nr:hypothetical protein [Gaiellaceae bacterium]